MKEIIRKALLESGAVAVGFARAGTIDSEVIDAYRKWIDSGCHAEMAYLSRHAYLKETTESILPGAQSIVSLAFSYVPERWRDASLPSVAAYAYGGDYHDVVRERLNPIISRLKDQYGGQWRICVDSAPLAERYWARKSGIGVVGLNGCVITPGAGSLCFLTEILTTLEIQPDEAIEGSCIQCGSCIDVCPGGALRGDSTLDSRKCISYISIEKKGELTEDEKRLLEDFPAFFGCDRCLRVCPHNEGLMPTNISEFHPGVPVDEIIPENRRFRKNPVKNTKKAP